MPTSTPPSRNSTPRWAKRAVASPVPTRSGRGMRSLRAIGWNGASALALAGACARPHPSPLTPGAEPELRVGLIAGAPSVTLGGDGELLVTDDSNGEPIGPAPAGPAWSAPGRTPRVTRRMPA